MSSLLDHTDRLLIAALRRAPRSSIAEMARTLKLARGTVQSRLARLHERGIITGYGPDVSPSAAGFDVLAFTTLAIAQGAYDNVIGQLRSIPQIVEVHTVTGSGDMLLRIVAESNDHLADILQAITGLPDVVRSETQLALRREAFEQGYAPVFDETPSDLSVGRSELRAQP